MAPVYHAIIVSFLTLFITGELIDPKEMPRESFLCSSICDPPEPIGPCNLDTSQCPPDSTDCGMYDSNCYCQQTTQLECAWSCPWWEDWMKIEDWLFKKCPQAPTLDFDKAPKCAAQCLAEKTIDYGCLTRNTNCFCIHGDLFDCNYNCNDKDKEKLKAWLMDSCKVSEAQAQAGVTSSGFKEAEVDGGGDKDGPIFTERKRRKPRWYEGLAIALLCASFLFVVGFFAWMRLSERKSERKSKQRHPHTARPRWVVCEKHV